MMSDYHSFVDDNKLLKRKRYQKNHPLFSQNSSGGRARD